MTRTGDRPLHNDDVEWDEFDPATYWKHNYGSLREDDGAIIALIRDFFAEHLAPIEPGVDRVGIDVGSGANLYPALGMLPWCSKILLTDRSEANVEWLKANTGWATVREGSEDTWEWMPFWRAYGCDGPANVRALLAERSKVAQQNLFELPTAQYDIGTMFFVAESITEDPEQFKEGVDRFLGALRVEALFVIACMEGRTGGYHVGGRAFPSTNITRREIEEHLRARTRLDLVQHIDVGQSPLDDPYTGMVVACGRARC